MTSIFHRGRFIAMACGASLILAGCGKSVEGNTYEGMSGTIKIEFQSGGKAVTSIGPLSTDCTYTEDSKSITLSCAGQPTVLTINEDGSLSGPQGSVMVRLTKKQ